MSDAQQNSSTILVATVASAHGVRGYVRVVSHTAVPESIFEYNGLQIDDMPVALKMVNRLSASSSFVCKLDICDSVEDAKLLCGKRIEVPRKMLPALGEGEYYIRDLVGYKVLGSAGDHLGVVREIYNYGAGDIVEYVDKNGKYQMVLLNKDFVTDVDTSMKFIKIADYDVL